MDLGKVAALVIVASPRLPRQDLRQKGGGWGSRLSVPYPRGDIASMHACADEGRKRHRNDWMHCISE